MQTPFEWLLQPIWPDVCVCLIEQPGSHKGDRDDRVSAALTPVASILFHNVQWCHCTYSLHILYMIGCKCCKYGSGSLWAKHQRNDSPVTLTPSAAGRSSPKSACVVICRVRPLKSSYASLQPLCLHWVASSASVQLVIACITHETIQQSVQEFPRACCSEHHCHVCIRH